jgi:hypothetical protein
MSPWYLFHSIKTVEPSKNPGNMYHIKPLHVAYKQKRDRARRREYLPNSFNIIYGHRQ